tara:strand:+ start:51028 stop:51879 length:852 start_codon:yes stop_codon:yes gene_type:complete
MLNCIGWPNMIQSAHLQFIKVMTMNPTINKIYENDPDIQGMSIQEQHRVRKAMIYVMQTIQKVLHDTDVTEYIDAAIGTPDKAFKVARAFKLLEASDLLEQGDAKETIIAVITQPNPEDEANDILRNNLKNIFLGACEKINQSNHQAAKLDFVREIMKIMRLTIQKFDAHEPGFDYNACQDIANKIQSLSSNVVEGQLTHKDIQAFIQATQAYTTCDRMKAALAALAGAALGLVAGFAVAGVPGAALGAVVGLGLFGAGYASSHQKPYPFTDLVDAAKSLISA